MARYGNGLGLGEDLHGAVRRACAQALREMDGAPHLLLAFVSGADPQETEAALAQVHALTAPRAMIGCSASGVIGAGRGVMGAAAVSVWAAQLSGEVEVRPFHLEVMRAEEGAAVVGLPERVHPDEVVVLLVDAWSFPLEGFVKQANSALPGVPFVGAVADGRRAGDTRLFVDGRSVDRGAVGVVLAGLSAQVVVSQGCRPIGPAMTVTGSGGNVLHGLAGTPAVQRVQQSLGDLQPEDQALATSGLHIGIAVDEYADELETGDFLVRGILGTEPETGGLIVGDVVPVGTTVRLQVRDAETADKEMHALLTDAGPAGAALLFSCNGRGQEMFGTAYDGADHDVRATVAALRTSQVAGCFGGGEIGPIGGSNYLHTFTASVLCLPA